MLGAHRSGVVAARAEPGCEGCGVWLGGGGGSGHCCGGGDEGEDEGEELGGVHVESWVGVEGAWY